MFDYKTRYGLNGKGKTISLFKETCDPRSTPIATISRRAEVENPHLYPLRKVYVELCTDDPSEYELVEQIFEGDFDYWDKLCSNNSLRNYINDLRQEAAVARKSKAFKTIKQEAFSETSRNRFAAAKYLIEEPWKPRETKTRKAKSTQEAYTVSGVSEDVKRLKEQGFLN